jgi:hypothetical protein
MPTMLRIGPYRFYFYSYDCAERKHTHVDHERKSAKFWIEPDVLIADNHGFNRSELRKIERVIRKHLETLRDEWNDHCANDDTDQD